MIDKTDAGRRVAPPTPDHPAYYHSITIGFREIGTPLAHFQGLPPPPPEIERLLTAALVRQNYLEANRRHPASLALVFRWGSLVPVSGQFTKMDCSKFPPRPVTVSSITNQNEILTYAIGEAWPALARSTDFSGFPDRVYDSASQEIFSSIREGMNGGDEGARYFLLVSALDDAALQAHQSILLWRAHVSAECWGHSLTETLPALVASSAPFFGRETAKPVILSTALVPNGEVIVGTPVLKAGSTGSASAR